MKESSEQGCGAETHDSQQSHMVGCGPSAGVVAEAVLQTGCGIRTQLPVPELSPPYGACGHSSGAAGHPCITRAAHCLVPPHAPPPLQLWLWGRKGKAAWWGLLEKFSLPDERKASYLCPGVLPGNWE